MESLADYKSKKVESLRHVDIYLVEGTTTAIVEATKEYIPIEEFKEIFHKVGELTKQGKITKLIFDKRSLRIFHQPSMEWYFITWKEEMWAHGLRSHRKILPDDEIFVESVKIGREKIFRENPQIKARNMDIQYSSSIQEAIKG